MVMMMVVHVVARAGVIAAHAHIHGRRRCARPACSMMGQAIVSWWVLIMGILCLHRELGVVVGLVLEVMV